VPSAQASSGAGQSAAVVQVAEQNRPRGSPVHSRLSQSIAIAQVAPGSPASGQSRSIAGQSAAHVPSNPHGSVGGVVHAAITSASSGSASGRTRYDAAVHSSSPAVITPTSAPFAIAAPPESPVQVVAPAPPARAWRGATEMTSVATACLVPRGPFATVAPKPTSVTGPTAGAAIASWAGASRSSRSAARS